MREDLNMKKSLITITAILALSTLAGCTSKNSESKDQSETDSIEEKITLKIASPAGAPALSLYKMYKQDNVEINAVPENVIGYLSADSNKDIVIAPTNALAAVMKKNAPYKIAATVTFGNFYIASTGNDDNNTMEPGDYVVLFQQNGLPDKLFQYVYGDDFTNLHYVESAALANACLMTGKNESDNNHLVDYVMVPQPALTGGLQTNTSAKLYANVQEDYKTKSNGLEITQASIFVRDSADKTQVDYFLNKVENDIKELLATPSILNSYVEGLDELQLQSYFGAKKAALLVKTLTDNSLGLGYKNALTNKASIDNFLMSLKFTNEETNQNVYYQ